MMTLALPPAGNPTPVSDAARSVAQHGGIAPTRWNRLENDRYFTIEADWIIPALLSKVQIVGPVLEPAAGVGHMVRELRHGHGLEVIASDLHAYEDPLVPDIGIADIRAIDSLRGFKWVVTNLPYDQQTELGAYLVQLGARDGCSVALLTRSEWLIARARRALVHEHPHFAGIVHLTARPRWFEKRPKRRQGEAAAIGDNQPADEKPKSPRFYFSWLIWSAAPRPTGADPRIRFAGRMTDRAGRLCGNPNTAIAQGHGSHNH
jgi:hypothetical protein